MAIFLVTLFFMPFFYPSAKAMAPVVATASVDRALISTDDTLTFSVVVEREKSIHINLPDIGSRISGFRITDFGTEEKEEEKTRALIRKWFSLRADIAGSYVLPEIEIPYSVDGTQKSVKTSELFVEVQSPKTAGDASQAGSDIRDIKPLERSPIPWGRWIALVAILTGAAAGFLIYRWKKRKAPKWVPPLPHEVALQKLDELVLPPKADPQLVKRFYFNLSEIVRCYVEDRYGLRATDMTSEEIIRQLKKNSVLPEGEKPAFVTFLKETDTVKFTDFYPPVEIARTVRDRAKKFVIQTKPVKAMTEPESLV